MGIIFFFIGLLQLEVYQSANILGIAPLNGKSHFIMFEAIFKELARKGHVVDVIGHFPLKKPVQGYNDLPIGGNFPDLVNNLTIDFVTKPKILDLMLAVAGPSMCKEVLGTKTLQRLRNTTKKYDLLITEFFVAECMLGFSHIFSIPTVALTTSVTLPWYSQFTGLPDNPSYMPNYLTPFTPIMTLQERVINTAVTIGSKIVHDLYSVTECNIIAKEFFGPDLPDLRQLARNVSLLLVNSHFSVHMARPAVPNFVEVAGLHINDDTSLSKYFEESLKTDLNGVIYLSFGSMLLTESIPKHRLQALFDAFAKIPYKVLWKATRERFPSGLQIPSNIQFETWMPQMGILCHPNVKLFVSHGGMMGGLEALYCAVPILGIPIFADQLLNVKTNAARGLAVYVSYESITEESVTNALNLLLNDSSYKDNVKKASALFKDRPTSAMETAIYWIEYVLRHNGARHLRTIGADLPWYQYYLVDVTLVFLTLILVFTIILYYVILSIYDVIFKNRSKIKQH